MKLLFFSLLFLLPLQGKADIDLKELGVSDTVTEENSFSKQEFAERKEKLKTHEMLGLATWGLMTATMFTAGSALDNDTHMYLALATTASYFTTAYFAYTAPKPVGVVDKGRIKWHKRLSWIHLPLMVIVPYLGFQYKNAEDAGRKHSSIEKLHPTLAGVLYGSFTLSTALMVIEF